MSVAPLKFISWNPIPQSDSIGGGAPGGDQVVRVEPSGMALVPLPQALSPCEVCVTK